MAQDDVAIKLNLGMEQAFVSSVTYKIFGLLQAKVAILYMKKCKTDLEG